MKGFLEENLLSLLHLMRVAVADFVQLHTEFLVELLVRYLVVCHIQFPAMATTLEL
jgi:hypothetical protein